MSFYSTNNTFKLIIFMYIMLLMFCFINYYSYIPYPIMSAKKKINIKTMNSKW